MASDCGDRAQTSYVFVRILGKGAFGEAILYRKTDDNSLVVWKEVNLAQLSDKARRDAQNEIDILSFLNHANIVSYYNHFLDNDTLFIEMEYANGGSLHDKIAQATELFSEPEVLWYMFQITSALSFIHQYGIIHRDIKTLNIFMTKVGLLKLGDFGISKILESKGQMAESIVGTPYYMSPELVKGERYNYKSDIWALGCVLYEMLTLTRTFQASNPLKLAFEIVQSDHESIDNQYSAEMQQLVNIMLCKDPNERPTADEILTSPLFSDAKEKERKIWELNSSSRKLRLSTSTSTISQPVVTSKMCEVYLWGGGKITPQKLEFFTREKSPIQVATGHFHFAAITFEKELYTWSNPQGILSMCGQLGHGDTAAYKAPKRVDALLGTAVHQVACGKDFTLCVSDEGALYGFGSNYYGCVGMSGEEEVLSPQIVEFFMDHPVDQVACGDAHVAVLTRYGDVYTWGMGEFGRLGLGTEDDFDSPQKVDLPGKHLLKEIIAGSDGTFLVCNSGKVLACGSNEFNKLGFNSETSGLRKCKERTYDIQCKSTFTTIKPLSHFSITTVATGKTHSAAVDCFGHIFTFGSNRYGQLGLGDFRPRMSISRVGSALTGQRVVKVACGDYFTVVTTSENHIFAWGRGENGRLGAEFTDQGRGPGGQCIALPRPIFGSMHIVPCMSSRHWNTIIIAEKVLNSKTLRTQDSRISVSSPKGLSEETDLLTPGSYNEADSWSDISMGIHESSEGTPDEAQTRELDWRSPVPILRGLGEINETASESSIPCWLKQELQEAEVIPIPSASQSPIQSTPETSTGSKDMLYHSTHRPGDTAEFEDLLRCPSAYMPGDTARLGDLQTHKTPTLAHNELLTSNADIQYTGQSICRVRDDDVILCQCDGSKMQGLKSEKISYAMCTHEELAAMLAVRDREIEALQKTVAELKAHNAELLAIVERQNEQLRQLTSSHNVEDFY